MKFLSGILLSIFSGILILVQGCFISWNKAYPEILFYIITIISVISAVSMLIAEHGNKKN